MAIQNSQKSWANIVEEEAKSSNKGNSQILTNGSWRKIVGDIPRTEGFELKQTEEEHVNVKIIMENIQEEVEY